MPVTSSDIRVLSSNSRVTSWNPWVTNSNPQAMSSNIRARRLKLKARVARAKARVGRLKARVRKLKARVDVITPRVTKLFNFLQLVLILLLSDLWGWASYKVIWKCPHFYHNMVLKNIYVITILPSYFSSWEIWKHYWNQAELEGTMIASLM